MSAALFGLFHTSLFFERPAVSDCRRTNEWNIGQHTPCHIARSWDRRWIRRPAAGCRVVGFAEPGGRSEGRPAARWGTVVHVLLTGVFRHTDYWTLFAIFRKVTISFVMSVLSFRVGHLGFHWTEFYEIWYLSIFRKSVEKIQVLLKYDKNNGTLHSYVFTFTIISCWILLWMRNIYEALQTK